MTTAPEYPIISTADLKEGQQYRYGPQGDWHISKGRWSANPQWVEAKPAPPFLAGDRVRHHRDAAPATVKQVGEEWLIVQVDAADRHASHEEAWLIRSTERIEDDQ